MIAFFVRDPKQCYALFDPRFARISTDAQDDTDENRKAEPCMESATCCGMELIAKQSYGIKTQKNVPLVMPYAYGDTIHANA